MRLLDVGAHDGFLAKWLIDQHPGGLHVDAIELHTGAAAICGERITGECKVGLAENAPDLFDAGSYDAVLSYEVLEHVADIAVYLDALEAMVAPGGRIYLSTPDGTFGAGSNPHHLRALRAIDVADLLRHRGELIDMTVGSDGVTVAVYEPRPRREDIAIFTVGGGDPWHPADIETRGLGGSETAAVRVAEGLSSLGFVVTVYADVREDTCWKDVIFRHWSKFDPLDSRAGLVCSRIPEVGDRPIAANTRLLWLHDTDCGDRMNPRRAEAFDHVLVLSEWHERHVARRYPFLKDRLLRTRNGIHHAYFAPRPWMDRAKQVLYTSSPDRGLDVLLDLWPRVVEQVPDAELHHCYADVYDKVAGQDAVIAAHRDRIRELSAEMPSVKRLGSLSQPALAQAMCEARVWAHPSHSSAAGGPFHETSCIGAMEAQAAGCLVVASSWGALTETVRWGHLVNSGALSDRWRDAFVTHIVEGLTNSEVGRAAVEKAPVAVADLGWGGVAEQLGKLIAAGVRG